MKGETRQLNVEVSSDDLDWFDEAYPMKGAKTWLVRTAFRKFRELHEVKPDEIMEAGLRELESF